MAIDSAAKRRAISGIPTGLGLTPTSPADVAWRQDVGWGYRGIPPVEIIPLDVAFLSFNVEIDTAITRRCLVARSLSANVRVTSAITRTVEF